MLTEPERRRREAVIEFASSLYGATWRERLAETARVPKRAVIDLFEGQTSVPPKLVLTMLRSMEIHLEAQAAETAAMSHRIKELRLDVIAHSIRAPSDDTKVSDTAEPVNEGPRPFAGKRVTPKESLRLVASNGRDRV